MLVLPAARRAGAIREVEEAGRPPGARIGCCRRAPHHDAKSKTPRSPSTDEGRDTATALGLSDRGALPLADEVHVDRRPGDPGRTGDLRVGEPVGAHRFDDAHVSAS